MISKELLSEVLGIRTIVMNPILEPENKVGYLVYGSQNTPEQVRSNHKQINIYELTHKCKEWAWEKHRYKLKSGIYVGRKGHLRKNEYACTDYEDIVETADTEPEAIFQACQWILDNKDN